MCLEPLFIPNFEPLKIYYFMSHFSHHVVQFAFSYFQYVLTLLFFPNSDESNFNESKSLRIKKDQARISNHKPE